MQFLVIGTDGTDEGALARRLAVREQHLAVGEELVASGAMWYGAALQNDDGEMTGSVLIMDFDSEQALNDWLEREPYIVGDVWRTVEVRKAGVRNPWQFNRDESWFIDRAAGDPAAS